MCLVSCASCLLFGLFGGRRGYLYGSIDLMPLFIASPLPLLSPLSYKFVFLSPRYALRTLPSHTHSPLDLLFSRIALCSSFNLPQSSLFPSRRVFFTTSHPSPPFPPPPPGPGMRAQSKRGTNLIVAFVGRRIMLNLT